MEIKKTNNQDDYTEFDIHEILIKPFDNILSKETDKPVGSTGWYVTITFTVKPTSYIYHRLSKHINPDFDGFYLDYVKDTSIFTFTEAVTKTPTTIGALEELEQLKQKNPNPNYRFVASSYLFHCLETLHNFWD